MNRSHPIQLISIVIKLIFFSQCTKSFVPNHKKSSLKNERIKIITKLNSKNNVDKGFNLLETAGGIVPQGQIVSTAKTGWKFIWSRMMAELAPQDKSSGSYTRPSYKFQNTIGNQSNKFPDEANRYQLYVGNACPWCHRTLLVLKLRGITTDEIGVTQLQSNAEQATRGGWIFSSENRDPIYNSKDLYTLYNTLQPNFQGRCTAPLLVDKVSKQIVSNESSDIVKMLNSVSLQNEQKPRIDLYPMEKQKEIDETCTWIYNMINNGVYQCGFSTTQSAYDTASKNVRLGLSKCNEILSKQPFLCTSGKTPTLADVYLLPTALRYDAVYSPFFRAGGVHLRLKLDFPFVYEWLCRCWEWQNGVIRDTFDIGDAQWSYYQQLFPLNPSGLVPTQVTLEDIGLYD